MIEVEQPEGVIVQFGGQTPLKLARGLVDAGVPLLGTPVDSIDLAEDRARFGGLLQRARPAAARRYATAGSDEGALEAAEQVGYPLLVRPSYVLGGRAMEICYSREQLADYLRAHRAQRRRRRSTSTASSRTRSRSTWTRSATARRSRSAA